MIDDVVLAAAESAFGGHPKRKPRQPYASAEDMLIVGQSRDAFASARFAGKFIKQTPLKVTFLAWATRIRPWRFHGFFGFIRPWVLKLRSVQTFLHI